MLGLDSSHEGRYHIYMVGCSRTLVDGVLNYHIFKQINTIGHIVTRSNLVVTWKVRP